MSIRPPAAALDAMHIDWHRCDLSLAASIAGA